MIRNIWSWLKRMSNEEQRDDMGNSADDEQSEYETALEAAGVPPDMAERVADS